MPSRRTRTHRQATIRALGAAALAWALLADHTASGFSSSSNPERTTPSTTTTTTTKAASVSFPADRRKAFRLHHQHGVDHVNNGSIDSDIDSDIDSENSIDNSNDNSIDNSIDKYNDNDNNNNKNKDTKKARNSKDPWLSLLVAASFVVSATLGSGLPAGAEDPVSPASTSAGGLGLVSPGTATIEARVRDGDTRALLRSTETAVTSLAKTALLDGEHRAALAGSVQRVFSAAKTELSSVEAWREVVGIVRDYGADLQRETEVVVRPPSDLRRMVDDAVDHQRVNLLVNGEILQITAEYRSGTSDPIAAGDASSAAAVAVVQPDDEWVLRIRGYKGFDPTALSLAMEPARYERSTPQWLRDWNDYWNSPLDRDSGLGRVFGQGATHGDVIVVEGAAAVALSYAISYAYYVSENEKAEEEARQKAAKRAEAAKKKKEAARAKAATAEPATKTKTKTKKKKEAAKTNQAPKKAAEPVAAKAVAPVNVSGTMKPLAAAGKTGEAAGGDDDDDINVFIDFDKKGKVQLTAIEPQTPSPVAPGQRKNGLLPFLQALYFPWLGFFFSSSPKPGEDNRPRIVALLQALYFPWAGVFFPRLEPGAEQNQEPSSQSPAQAGAGGGDGGGNNGVLPFVRALCIPWIGILMGK